jgi:putative transposase
LEVVSLDGRTQDYWVDFGDGKPKRPVMIALVDVYSNMILGWLLSKSENAAATSLLISNTCKTHGIFDCLYTDNGSAFSGHVVAGGNVHKFRGKKRKEKGIAPPGMCDVLGIRITFAMPANPGAKIAENTFSQISRSIDNCPEFEGCHAGHKPGASPSKNVVPIPIAKAEEIVGRRIDDHNREVGRKAQGANGRSYEQMFQDGIKERNKRVPSQRQLYLASLVYEARAVDMHGQIHINNWTYGGIEVQTQLSPFHGKGQKVLIGYDPNDLSQPAVIYDKDYNLICDNVPATKAGDYLSKEGAELAAKNRSHQRKVAKEYEAINAKMDNQRFDEILAISAQAEPKSVPLHETNVLEPNFNPRLKPKQKQTDTAADVAEISEERMAEFERNRNEGLGIK